MEDDDRPRRDSRKDSSPTGDELVSTNTVHKNEIDSSNQISGDLSITAEAVSGSMVVFRNLGPGTKEVDGNAVSNLLVYFQKPAAVRSLPTTQPRRRSATASRLTV